MDCSWGEGNNACDGGEDFRAYQWIMKHGLASEEDYGPYLAVVCTVPSFFVVVINYQQCSVIFICELFIVCVLLWLFYQRAWKQPLLTLPA